MDQYKIVRAHFIRETVICFEFLVSEFGFNPPVHNTTIFTNDDSSLFPITDFILYTHKHISVEIANEYQPHNYTFRVDILTNTASSRLAITPIAHTNSLTYDRCDIQNAAERLRSYLRSTLLSENSRVTP